MEKVKLLEERIKKDGRALGKTVLKVDSFINHQVDSEFMDALGKDFAEHFKEYGITKVFTIESSGIAPALMTAKYLDVPYGHFKETDFQNFKRKSISDKSNFLYKRNKL